MFHRNVQCVQVLFLMDNLWCIVQESAFDNGILYGVFGGLAINENGIDKVIMALSNYNVCISYIRRYYIYFMKEFG